MNVTQDYIAMEAIAYYISLNKNSMRMNPSNVC
jgi:hypothetical protein